MDVASLIDQLDRTLGGFEEFLHSDDNCFPLDTQQGIFAACTQFLRNRHWSDEAWEGLGRIVNEAAQATDESGESPCASFIEELASSGHAIEPYLQGEALAYWNRACPAD